MKRHLFVIGLLKFSSDGVKEITIKQIAPCLSIQISSMGDIYDSLFIDFSIYCLH